LLPRFGQNETTHIKQRHPNVNQHSEKRKRKKEKKKKSADNIKLSFTNINKKAKKNLVD
jgi:hypothetical protein